MVSFAMCLTQWLISKMNKKNSLMLKVEDVFILIKLDIKSE